MKRFPITLLALAGFLYAQDDIRPLTILHSNDLHAQFQPTAEGLGGFAYLAAEVRHQRAGCTTCLYLKA